MPAQQPEKRRAWLSQSPPAAVTHRSPVIAGTSARWLEAQASPAPRSTALVLRHEGIRHRRRRWFGLSRGVARARPWRRAMPSGARTAKLPPSSHHSQPGLRTDSRQTYPSRGTRTCHQLSNERCTGYPDHERRLVPGVLPEHRPHAHVPPDIRALSPAASGQSSAVDRSLRGDRRDGRCRCREASARTALTTPKDSRCGSRLRHRRDEGRRQTRKLRKAT
jgi:hypothetical protein